MSLLCDGILLAFETVRSVLRPILCIQKGNALGFEVRIEKIQYFSSFLALSGGRLAALFGRHLRRGNRGLHTGLLATHRKRSDAGTDGGDLKSF